MRRSHSSEPALITSVAETPEHEYDRRRRKYAIMMTMRAVAVLAAATTYRVSLWLALGFVVAGMVLPWCAVIIANDGPAKRRPQVRGPGSAAPERALPAGNDDERVVDG